MSDFLAAKDWSDALKKHKGDKDGGLGEALKSFEKSRGKDSEEQLEALDAVVSASVTAQKALKDQKELLKYVTQVAAKAKETLKRLEAEAEEAGEEGAVDKPLHAAIKRAKTARMYFALVARGSTEGKLLITKAKVKPTEVADCKKDLGGGRVFRGVCFGENGRLVFELKKEPPATLEKLLKKTAKVQTGLLIKPLCRVTALDEDLGEEPDDESDAPPAPKRPGETTTYAEQQVRARLVAIAADLKRALAEKRGDVAAMQRLSGQLQEKVRAGGFNEALTQLTMLEGLVREALAAEEAGAKQGVTPAAEYAALVEKLTPQLRQAIEQKGPLVKDLKLLFSEAQALGRGKNFAQALVKLREAAEVLKKALESESSEEGDAEAESAEAAYARRQAAVQKLYEAVFPRVSAGDADRAKTLEQLHTTMTAAAAQGDFPIALARLEELEPALRSAGRAADAREEITQGAGTGNVPFKALRVRWANSQTAARKELERLKGLVLKHPEIVSDPRFDLIADEVGKFHSYLPEFDGRLEKLLDQADAASEVAAKVAARRQAAAVINDYQAKLAASPRLKQLDATLFGKVSIYGEMETTLSQLKAALSK